ncbi:CubicO group peptidase (beta-lactamase class C family) [Neolewinella xylanilytica]|uniref:CubicO group peptidase (Beta-lactamase class C family) n=2 Tax=Neolewinella xylanilytica TaxID=1514080 RepID=A0A2S6I228_9BACT|nr:CubicO group peptidase (beta-lactamase class C family) [Neolewinella xylanilytica]
MLRHCLLICLLVSISAIRVSGQTAITGGYGSVDSLLAAEYPPTGPGIAVLASKGDKIVFRKSYGLADIKNNVELSTEMIFEIGSMTKQFTSAAVLQLVEAGRVRLDDPIRAYVSGFPEKPYPITIHQLLSQTSGIPEFFDVDESEFDKLATVHTPEELIDYYRDRPLDFEPGTEFAYSNSNYPLLGLVVERVTGIPLAEYFERFIFTPLGMDHTSLWYSSERPPVPVGYRLNAAGEQVRSPPIDGSTVYAAGGIVSTLGDLYRWNNELKRPTHLSKRIVSQLIREKKTTDKAGTGYGYGFFVGEWNGHRLIHHGGNMYGFTSAAMYLPKPDVFVCVLANSAFANTENIARFVAGHLLEAPIAYYRQLAPHVLQDYVGRYILEGPTEKQIDIKLHEGVLVVHFPDNPASDVSVYGDGPDTFSSPRVDLSMVFAREQGAVVGFTAYQGGAFAFRRVP